MHQSQSQSTFIVPQGEIGFAANAPHKTHKHTTTLTNKDQPAEKEFTITPNVHNVQINK